MCLLFNSIIQKSKSKHTSLKNIQTDQEWYIFHSFWGNENRKNPLIIRTKAAKTEKKGYVQSSLDQRKKALEIDFQSDNVESSGDQENSGKFGEDEAYT